MLTKEKECVLEPPKGSHVIENATSVYWFDENGILCSITKKSPPISVEESRKLLEEFKQATQGKKFCMLLDVTYSTPNDKAAREFAAEEFPKITKAMAMVSGSAMGRMLANIFFALKPTPYPAKMFNNVADAKSWLKQYL